MSDKALHSDQEFEIRDIAFGGAGIGHVHGLACFIKGVIDGEKVRGHISKVKRRFMEADLVEVLNPSPHRIDPPCPYFSKCGGCAYQHLDYSHQLKIKEQQLREALRRIGDIKAPPVKAMIPSPNPFHYRNRITVHVKEGIAGFFAEKSRNVIDIERCLLASEDINQALHHLRSQRPMDGNYLLGEKGSYGGFRQVNNEVAKILLHEVMQHAGSGELLIDAYCGAGFFSHTLSDFFKKVIGIERSQGSIALARKEAASHEDFLEGGVEELLPGILSTHTASLGEALLILDPPSEGLSELVAAAILRNPPGRIIYVSCNPGTLARDLKRLSSFYHLQESTPLDMFPQTAEIESVSVLVPR